MKFGAGVDNRSASRFLFGIVGSLNFHADKALCRFGVGQRCCHILFIPCNGLSEPGNVSGIPPQYQIFQSEPLIQVVRFQHIQLTDFHIQIAFLDDQGVAGSQSLDFGITQGGFVHVICDTGGSLAGHDLGDELLLVFHQLVQICVKGIFRDITKDFNLRVLVALPDNSSQSLGKITWAPRAICVMQGNQFILTIRACTHLCGAAYQHTHLPGTDFGK